MAQSLATTDRDSAVRELRAMGCGRSVGRYTLMRRLAAGGMAEVYIARSQGLSGFEKKVAIKKILPQHAHNERFIRMLEDEARITVGLTHSNIAQVYEFGFDGEDYFLVMEFVEGRPLNRLMQRIDERGLETIPVDHAVQVMIEVAKGLDYAHKQKDSHGKNISIVHRDVSPQNVLITYEGDVKLIDFGIARAEGRSHQTSHGVIKGKLRYLAPEIAAGEEPDHRADVYCCGIVLFEMLTGEAMFAPKTDLEAIELATEAKVKSPRSRNPKVPRELDDIVMRALVRDRGSRYQTAKDLATDLKLFLNQHFPAYLGHELGDLMKQMFEAEIGADRRLDALAEAVAAETITADDQVDDSTQSARAASLIGPGERKYRQLVTRHAIQSSNPAVPAVKVGGADGGRSMMVVPADDRKGPTSNGPHGERGVTKPPLGEAPSQTAAFVSTVEPTVKADNPFVNEAPPTPVILEAVPRSPTEAISARAVAEDAVVVPPAPQLGIKPLPVLIFGTLGLVLIASLAFVFIGADHPEQPVAIAAEPIAELPIAEDRPALIRIETRPSVKLSVEVDGLPAIVEQHSPVEIADLAPDEPHHFVVRAEGYLDQDFERRLSSGETAKASLALVAATGTIELVNLRGASVKVSKGEVLGSKIVAIPLDSMVSVKIQHDFAKPFEKEIFVKDINPIRLEVPAPPQPPKGTLVINARPVSTVWIDGDKHGTTPLTVKIRPGQHKVVLQHPSGEKKTFLQKVSPGKTKTFIHRW